MIRGRAWVYGDDVNTDVIFPGRYLAITDPEEMAKHAMEDLDPEFVKGVREGDIIVAGRNFGCGSSREQAATCLKVAGIRAIIAKSYARIFFRNAINQGLPALECDSADFVQRGDQVEVDLIAGLLKDLSSGGETRFKPLPEFVRRIVEDGGLIPNLQRRLNLR